jgi:hypothetical protein
MEGMTGGESGQLVYTFEDVVDWLAPASPVPPAFNDSFVVTIDSEVSGFMLLVAEKAGNKFEANSLCPADISFSVQGLPAGDESPCSPFTLDDDGNPNT